MSDDDQTTALFQAFQKWIAEHHDLDAPGVSTSSTIEELQVRLARLLDTEKLTTGDIVYWKSGLKNRRRPKYGEPAIVVSVLDAPMFDTKDESASTSFQEPLDLVIGLLGEETADFYAWHVDSRRMTKERQG